MPAVDRPAAVGGPVRRVARHWWRGAGIPKVIGSHPPAEANPPGLEVVPSWSGGAFSLALTNARAGHRLPSGDPERWIRVEVSFTSAGGTVGTPYRHRIGQIWRWHPTPEKQSDNRLAPRETRVVSVDVPEGADAALVVVSSHRMSQENADYHELVDYPLSVETHRIEVVPTAP